MMNWEATLTMPAHLKRAVRIAEKHLERKDQLLQEPKKTQRLIWLIFLSIDIHGHAGENSHMTADLNSRYHCFRAVIQRN